MVTSSEAAREETDASLPVAESTLSLFGVGRLKQGRQRKAASDAVTGHFTKHCANQAEIPSGRKD